MMFFRYNKNEQNQFDKEELEANPLIKFFQDSNKNELLNYANEVSPEAAQLFEGNLQSILGQLPEEICQTQITMNKDALQQLLFSSMLTGYIAKSVETKVSLEKCLIDGNKKDESEYSVDKQLNDLSKDELDEIL